MEPWRTEASLVAVFDQSLPKSKLWLGARGYRTFIMEEVEGMRGRVDRMMVSVSSATKRESGKPELLQQETCSKILVSLHVKQPKSVRELADHLGITPVTIRYWLARLEAEALVRRISNNAYVLGPRSGLPRLRIWSFEAKLKNWQRALYQASRYRSFSHRSFVVMPQRYIRPALSNVERFRRAKIGLIGVTDAGAIRVYTKPREHDPRSPVMFTRAVGYAIASIR